MGFAGARLAAVSGWVMRRPVRCAAVTFDEAMARLRGPGSRGRRVTRPGLPGCGVEWQFGAPVIALEGPVRRFISYTPTQEDMRAADWVDWVA